MTTNIQKIKAAIKSGCLWTYVGSLKIQCCYGQERALYLAYGYLRGIPYRNMEPTAAPLFSKYGHAETEFLKGLAALITVHQDEGTAPVTPGMLMAWIGLQESEAHKAKRARAEEKSRVLREARRAEYQVTLQKEQEARKVKVA